MSSSFWITIGLSGLLLVMLNAVFVLVILSMRRRMSQALAWPSTRGIVMASSLESRASREGDFRDYPVVRYSYQVGQQAFQGTRITLGPEVGGTDARRVIARYSAGSPVTVYYNPREPADALLEKSAPAQKWLWLLLVIFDCVLCGATPLVWWALSQ